MAVDSQSPLSSANCDPIQASLEQAQGPQNQPVVERRLCGPGCVVAAAFIGPGTVVSCTNAGASFSVSLLWCLTFSAFSAYFLQEMSARIGLSSCKGLPAAFEELHLPGALQTALRVLVCLGIGVASSLFEGGNISGAAVGLANLIGQPGWEAWISLLVGAIVAAIIGLGGTKLVQILMAVLVGVMSFVFVVCALLSRPSIGDVMVGLVVPQIPEGSLTTVLSLIGTTIVTYNLFLQAGMVADKERERRAAGGGVEDETMNEMVAAMRLDTGSSMMMGGIVSAAILVTAAYAFEGREVPGTIAEMADALEPSLGQAGRLLFFFGILSSGISSAVTAPLATQLTIVELCGWTDSPPKQTAAWAFVCIFGTGLAFVTKLYGVDATQLIVFAQVFNAILLPLVAGLIVFVAAQERLMGALRSSAPLVLVGTASTLVTLCLSVVNLSRIVANLR